MAESESTSTTQGVKTDFPELDKAVARVLVKHQVAKGQLPPPSELLVLPPEYHIEYFDQLARDWLVERQKERQG